MRLSSFVCVLVVAASACGDDGVPLADYESHLVDAICAYRVGCQYVPDVATCKASLYVDSSVFRTLLAKAKAGAIKYNAEQAAACLDEYKSSSCSYEGFYVSSESACSSVFTGTVAANNACVISADCASGMSCVATDQSCNRGTTCCPGTCQVVSTGVPVGGDCSSASCVATAYCASATSTCTAPIATAGASCNDIAACASPMICDVFANAPTCVTPAKHGETCDPDVVLSCADYRDHCDAVSLKCTPDVAVGETCAVGPNNAQCIDYADCASGTNRCVARPSVGGACTIDLQLNYDNCLGDTNCTGGTCALPSGGPACPRNQPESSPTPQAPVSVSVGAPASRSLVVRELVDGTVQHDRRVKLMLDGDL